MIDKQHGNLIFECDECSDTLETNEDEWNAAHAAFRLNGWKSYKDGRDWTHLCAKCG